ncbi:MAG: hypothetical protein ACPGGK_12730 [Pikeienuella sp.]
MWIIIAGPYTSGAQTEQDRAENLSAMNRAAVAVFDKGHTPIIGVNMALPVIVEAGADRFDDLMMPISLALADRCDACLRVGGPSIGADQECERLRAKGLPVFLSIDEVPEA